MRRFPFGLLLVCVNLLLLALVLAGTGWRAAEIVRAFADEQALGRVTQAVLSGRAGVQRVQEASVTSAQLLAQRPTLQRLLREEDWPAAESFLAQFQATSGLSGVAVVSGTRVLVARGALEAWGRWQVAPRGALGEWLVAEEDVVVVGAWAVMPDGRWVGVARALDAGFTAEMGNEVGLTVGVWPLGVVMRGSSAANTVTGVRRAAFDAHMPIARRLEDQAVYLAAVPVEDAAGKEQGVLDVALPTTATERSLQGVWAALGTLMAGAVVVTAVGGALLARWLSWPLSELTTAATRIGGGDLTTPVAAAPTMELGALASALEEMRRALLRLTVDLRRQEAEAQAIVSGIVEGVFSVDRERRIRYLNAQAAAQLGITPEAALGQFCGDVLRPQGVGAARLCDIQCPIVHARARGATRAVEHLQGGGGGLRTVVVTSAAPAGEWQVQVMRDETEREAVHRLRDAVLANLSHEFRTPLSAQLASIELLLDQLPHLTYAQSAELIVALQRGTLRLTQLVDNLLESARIEAGRDGLRRQRLALDEVLEDAIELMRPLVQQRGQSLEVSLPYPLPAVWGDGPRLTQVFVNLLANANKFAPADSVIVIGGEVADADVRVWVEDAGPGFPPGGPLFAPFMRVSAGIEGEPEPAGAGLGLWIVRAIITRHGGAVEAHNTARGARVTVTLPQGRGDEDSGR